jgi:Mg2+/Co2+ transporter CorB
MLADLGLGDLLLTAIWIFFLVLFFWIIISILMDIFRDHEMSGVSKAIWVLLLIVFTPLAALVYLIVRGGGMAERSMKQQQHAQEAFNEYVRATAVSAGAGGSHADELERLAKLKDAGTISDEEFTKMKAKIIG